MLIQPGTLKKICPQLHDDRCAQIENCINTICPQYGIDTADILHEFLANLLHESSCFTHYEESLNYTTEALVRIFSRARISTNDAIRYGRTDQHAADQKRIGDIIYGGDWGKRNLGNTEPDDGWELRGSGPIQLTGRDMLTRFSDYMLKRFNISKMVNQWAELLRTNDEYGMHSACWFFAIAKNLIPLAIDDNMKEIVRRINGGFNGIDDRLKYYELCKKYIV